MLRFTFLLALLTALFSISGNVLAQSQTRLREIEPIKRPQLERPQFESPSEDVLDPMDPDNEVDEDESTLDSLLDDEEKDEDSDLDNDEDDPAKERLTDDRIRQNWPRNTISEIDLSLAEVGRVPEDRSELLEGYGRFGPVSESLKVFAWEAPNIRYQPLYFEDVALERYGQTLTDYRQGIRSADYIWCPVYGVGHYNYWKRIQNRATIRWAFADRVPACLKPHNDISLERLVYVSVSRSRMLAASVRPPQNLTAQV